MLKSLRESLWTGVIGVFVGSAGFGCESGAKSPAVDTVVDTAVADTVEAVGDTLEVQSDANTAGDASDGVEDASDAVGDTSDGVEDAVETEVVDACAGVTCAVPADRCNDDRSGVVVSSDPVCVADGGEFACHASEATTACAVGTAFCLGERCMTHAEFCELDPNRRWTYVTKLAAGDQSDPGPDGNVADRCCFDFDGDGKIDNRLGQIFWQNRALLGNINEVAATQINSGALAMLVEVRGLPDPAPGDEAAPLNAEWVELMGAAGHEGKGAATGVGTIAVQNPSTWFGHTNLPRAFGLGRIVEGRLLSEDGQSVLRTGGTLPNLQLPIKHLRFDARVAVGPNGHGLTMGGLPGERGGKYGGLVPVQGFYDLINATVTDQCPCARFAPNQPPVDLETGECNTPIEGDCSAGEPYCAALTGPLCSAFLGLFAPDIDSDGDGRLDSLSVGFWFEGTSIELESCTPPGL